MINKITGEQVKQAVRFTWLATSAEYIKVTAEEQRSLWGAAPFGKLSIKVMTRGIEARRVVAFGQDREYRLYTWEQIAELINTGKKAQV